MNIYLYNTHNYTLHWWMQCSITLHNTHLQTKHITDTHVLYTTHNFNYTLLKNHVFIQHMLNTHLQIPIPWHPCSSHNTHSKHTTTHSLTVVFFIQHTHTPPTYNCTRHWRPCSAWMPVPPGRQSLVRPADVSQQPLHQKPLLLHSANSLRLLSRRHSECRGGFVWPSSAA